MARHDLHILLHFAGGYIAHPYWPEMEELINIQKASGMNRARTEKTRTEALSAYLQRQGLTVADYEDLEAKASLPWYRLDMRNDDPKAPIIVSSHQLYGCLIESCKRCPASLKPCDPNNLRHAITLSDFVTDRTASDGVYKRLVMPKNGQGQPLSNQRSLRMNPYIAGFTAAGTLMFFEDDLRENGQYVLDFLNYAGQRVGVGASRKMGYGRFTATTAPTTAAPPAP